MSDVLPPSNQESLTVSGPNVPPKNQAIERLHKRMEVYRDNQARRLPEYEQTRNHMNTQQMQETLVLRQKYLDSKAKKPNKKSSSASADKMKHDVAGAGTIPGNMNGMMQYHSHPPASHNGPTMGPGPHMNGPMGLNGPQQNGPMLQNGPNNIMNHGPNNGQSHNKRPLEDDSSNIQTDTAKRLNLDNGNNISDQNFIKREPSPLETKFNPGAGGFGGQVPPPVGGHPPPQKAATPVTSQQSPAPDVKPNVNSLNQEMKDSANNSSFNQSDNKLKTEISDSKDEVKAELGDSLKQEDTLGDLDLKDFDFDGMNADSLQDLMDDLPENFIDTFDFENSKIASDEKDSDELGRTEASENGQASSATPSSSAATSCHTSGNSVTTSTASAPGPTPAAETLKMMAQQHQQPPSSQSGPPFQGGPPMNPNSSMPNYQPPNSAMTGVGSMASSMSNMNMTSSMSDSTANSQNMMGQRGPPSMNDADPRLRAAVSQRFRLGNPNSIANSMSGGVPGGNPGMNTHPGMMNSHQRMPMGNSNMMGNMPNNQQGPGPGMAPNMGQMMSQQQVKLFVTEKYQFLNILSLFRCTVWVR